MKNSQLTCGAITLICETVHYGGLIRHLHDSGFSRSKIQTTTGLPSGLKTPPNAERSKLERVKSVEEVEHPIIREALKLVGIDAPYLEITSLADIPAGTGLGSSGSFTTALLKALHAWKMNLVHPA